MTFFKVNDPKNRELIKEVIAKRAVIREADRRRKMGEAFELEQLSRFFKPITKQAEKMTEKIEKGVKGLPGEIAKVLPKPINIMQPILQPRPVQYIQPPYPSYSMDEDETDTETVKTDETDYIDEKELSSFIKFSDGFYRFGDFPIKFTKDEEIKVNTKGNFETFTNSPKIYEIFTNKYSKITWDDLVEEEKADLGYLATNSNIFYNPDTGKKRNMIGNRNQWKNIFSRIWDSRFSYMSPQMLESERTQKEISQGKFKLSKIPEQYRTKVIKTMRKQRKQTGKGL